MKRLLLSAILLLALVGEAMGDCIILNKEYIRIGSRSGIKGVCSNNKLPITCNHVQDDGARCDGPSGGFSGNDLQALIFSACGCSVEEENELQLKKELERTR